jgi:hypothetical protein
MVPAFPSATNGAQLKELLVTIFIPAGFVALLSDGREMLFSS